MDILKQFGNYFKYNKKRIIQALILLIFLLFLAASVYYITIDDGTWDDDEIGRPSTYTHNVKISTEDETMGLQIDKEAIIKQALIDMGYTEDEISNFTEQDIIKILEVNKKLDKTVTTLDDCTQAEILWCITDEYSKYLDEPEELEKLLNAEIITQYPKMDEEKIKTGLNGIIQFHRYKTDGSDNGLTYISIEEFNEKIEDKNLDIIDYFTIDENENVLVGVVHETTEELRSNDSEMVLSNYTETLTDDNKLEDGSYSKTVYSVTSRTIDYKSVVSKYTMPFQYLWSIIVVGDDKGIALELADLVEDSEIVISIYDNITTTVDTSTYTYDKQRKMNVYASAVASSTYGGSASGSDSWEPVDEWKDDIDYEVEHKFTYKNNSTLVDVTKADVWIVDYSKEYEYEPEPSEPTSEQENGPIDVDSTEYSEDSGSPRIYNPSYGYETSYTEFPEYSRFEDELNELEGDVAQSALDNSDTTNTMYSDDGTAIPNSVSSGISSVTVRYYKHEIDKKRTDLSQEFKQKYVAQTPINNPKINKKTEEEIKNGTGEDNFVTILSDPSHSKAKDKITDEVYSWWIEILETNDDTKNMVELSKYLLYKVTDQDKFGVNSYDFSVYEENDFTSIGSLGFYGDWDGTGSQQDFINAVAPYAVIDMEQHDIYASVTIAQAIIESGWGKDSIAINYKNFFGMKAFSISPNEYWSGEYVELRASEGGTSKFRVYDSLMNSIYDHGRNFHATATYGRNGVLDCISQNLGPKEQLRRIAISGYAVYADGTISKPDGVRTYDQYLYEEFIVKYDLEKYDTMSSSDFSTVEGNEIIEIAKSKLNCPYQYGADGPDTFDCSGFVYWVYQQKGISVPRSTQSYSSYVGTSKEIQWEDARPGDILIILSTERTNGYGHAGIYLGNNQYIHSPRTNDVVKISDDAQSTFKHVFRMSN